MQLMKRVNTIIAAQLNEIVEGFEKPEQMLRQVIREMDAALQRATESTARAIAAEKRTSQELADCQEQAHSWRNRAAVAVKQGNDKTARTAIGRAIDQERLAGGLSRQLARLAETNERLHSQLDSMRTRLSDARRQLSSLIARQRSAEARQRFVKALGHFDDDAEAFHRFNELSGRVLDTEAEAEAIDLLCGNEMNESTLDAQIDAEMQVLKGECGMPAR